MPEERGLYPGMRVGEQLEYLGRLHGLNAPTRGRQTAGSVDWASPTAGRKVEALSHGNQQRVQLTAALVHGPDLLVLDEPLSGLDPTGIDAIGGGADRPGGGRMCVVFTSHQLDLVEDLCEPVTIIDHGRLVVRDGRRIGDQRGRAGWWSGSKATATPTGPINSPGHVSELSAGAVRLMLDVVRRQRRRSPDRHASGPSHRVLLRAPPPV